MNFGMLVFPQVEELDLVGPWEMVGMWRQIGNGPQRCMIVAKTTDPVSCAKGLSLNPHVSFDTCPPLDFLLVPGGQGTREAVTDAALVEFVTQQGSRCTAILSVCTGSFVLAAAGLLSGRKATTHWSSLQRLRELGNVQVVEQRWVRDGKIWTAAGVSAGIDLMLAFICETAGEDTAGKVQLGSEYYPSGVTYGNSINHELAPAYVKS